MRTPDQQTLIDVVNGWAVALTAARMAPSRRWQAAVELTGVRDALTLLWPVAAPVDVWRWPVLNGRQVISVVGGEVQDSAAHALRGVGPSVDLPGANGTALQTLVAEAEAVAGIRNYDVENGYSMLWVWQGSRGRWRCRYSHLPAIGVLEIGTTGNTTGAHLHVVLWLDGERVPPEAQEEFRTMLEG